MGELKLETLFERWRKLREPALLAEVFDRTSPELWQLALALARDVAEAEDVLQATYLAAIERADSFDEERRLTAWLAGILVNQVRLARRDRTRAIEPERVEPRPERDPHDRLERGELAGVMREALASLPSGDRAVLELALIDGRKAAEIAREQGRNPGAVRMQIHRGLERLRKLLPPSFALGAAWTATHGRGLAAVRAQVMQHASSAQVVSSAAVTSGLVLGGAAVATKMVLSGAALVAAATLAWFLWPHVESTAPVAPLTQAHPVELVSAAPATAPSAGAPIAERTAIAPAAPAQAPTAPSAKPGRKWLMRGRVSGAPQGRASEIRLEVTGLGQWNIEERPRADAGPDGLFEVDVSGCVEAFVRSGGLPSELLVQADHPACLREQVRIPFASHVVETSADGSELAVFECELRLTSAAVATGTIVTPADWSGTLDECGDRARVKVALWPLGDAGPQQEQALDVVDCGEEGRWVLRTNRGGSFVVVAVGYELRPTTVRVELVLGRETSVGPVVLTPGASISGIVRSRGGAPAPERTGLTAVPVVDRPGARYSVDLAHCGDILMYWREQGFYLCYVRARTRDDGTFRFGGLEEGEYGLQVTDIPKVHISGGRPTRSEIVVRAPAQGVELGGMPSSAGIVLTVDGRAPKEEELKGVLLDLSPGDRHLHAFELDMTHYLDYFRGEYAIQIEPDVEYTLAPKIGPFQRTVLAVGPLEPGEVRNVAVDLRHDESSGTLLVTLEPADHSVVAGATFRLFAQDDVQRMKPLLDTHMPAEAGAFRLAYLAPGRYWLRARPGEYTNEYNTGEGGYVMGTEVAVEVLPDTTSKLVIPLANGGRLRMCAKDERGGYVRAAVEVHNGRGDRVETEFYCQTGGTIYGCGWYLCEQGLNDHAPLSADRYEFTLKSEGFEPQNVPVLIEVGKTTTVEVVMLRK